MTNIQNLINLSVDVWTGLDNRFVFIGLGIIDDQILSFDIYDIELSQRYSISFLLNCLIEDEYVSSMSWYAPDNSEHDMFSKELEEMLIDKMTKHLKNLNLLSS
jgi:hypothetical protein